MVQPVADALNVAPLQYIPPPVTDTEVSSVFTVTNVAVLQPVGKV